HETAARRPPPPPRRLAAVRPRRKSGLCAGRLRTARAHRCVPGMKRIAFKDMPLRTRRFTLLPHIIHWVVFGLFLAGWAVAGSRFLLPSVRTADAPWPDGLLLVMATATTLASLTRRLPGQNVMLAAIVIALMGSAFHTVGGLTAIPFGPFVFTDRAGRML